MGFTRPHEKEDKKTLGPVPGVVFRQVRSRPILRVEEEPKRLADHSSAHSVVG